MTIELIIESILCLLLLVTSLAGVQFSGRLKKIKQGQDELAYLIHSFDEAAKTARTSLDGMQDQNRNLEKSLSVLVRRANGLISELSVMVNAGDNIAGRLEGAVDEVRYIGTNKNLQPRKNTTQAHQTSIRQR